MPYYPPRLTHEDVIDILESTEQLRTALRDCTRPALARKHGVSLKCVDRVIDGYGHKRIRREWENNQGRPLMGRVLPRGGALLKGKKETA